MLRQQFHATGLDESISQMATFQLPLAFQNYPRRYGTLINLESLQEEEEVKSYGLTSTTMGARVGKTISLTVQGLAEKRPSILKGDIVNVFADGIKYKGYVSDVQQLQVRLNMHREFFKRHITGKKYRIDFSLHTVLLSHQQTLIVIT